MPPFKFRSPVKDFKTIPFKKQAKKKKVFKAIQSYSLQSSLKLFYSGGELRHRKRFKNKSLRKIEERIFFRYVNRTNVNAYIALVYEKSRIEIKNRGAKKF